MTRSRPCFNCGSLTVHTENWDGDVVFTCPGGCDATRRLSCSRCHSSYVVAPDPDAVCPYCKAPAFWERKGGAA